MRHSDPVRIDMRGRYRAVRQMLAALAAGAVAAAHGGTEVAAGAVWVGSDLVNGRPSAVRLLGDTSSAAAGLFRVRFGAPRNCEVEARRVGADGDTGRYAIVDSGGGIFCDGLYPGTLAATAKGDALLVEIVAGGTQRNFALRRAGAPPLPDAADPRALVGTWRGTVASGQGVTEVALTVDGIEPGDTANTFRFEGARRCTLALGYEGATAAGFFFSVRLEGTTGGYCERLLGRYLVLQAPATALSYRFEPGDATCPGGCELRATRER
ncbi:MAG TPA: hypothetical protein VF217_11385 [Rhodanobacteraceae bacterium]